ncbi:MAG: molybdopterin-dependent oxidoreductase [Syntrophaceae bacterium]|nr:molybdopterin-dependent oxidoreductase [Syntrophaceae bacterium]
MTQTIKLKIDEIEVSVEKGKTILEAAQSAGIRIPTLCHDRRLTPFGACRLCVVQQKGKSELLPSCFTPVREGMEIITRSPEIFKSRRLQLQLLLLNHPMICPRCEKEGECVLQDLLYEYGVLETLYPWERVDFPLDEVSPLLQRDPNKCILCGRCVRICDEVQGIGELSFIRRGIKTAIDTDFHRPIRCEFCGQCLDTCPVGAITSDCFDYRTKAWELQETTTPCPYCSCGCLLVMGSKEGEIKRVFSDPEKGPNDGNLCVKGRFGWDFVDHPDRLKTPLLRVNGTLKETSWEEALRFVVDRLEKIKERYGAETIGGLVSNRLTNEEYYVLGKLFRGGIGTELIASRSKGTALTEGLAKTLGYPASTNSIREIRKADCLLLIGVDPALSHPIIKNEIHLAIRRNRAQLIVLGSYDIGLSQSTRNSPLSLPSILLLDRPGSEVSLLNGMIQTILREGLEDREFIAERTEGIEGLKQRVLSHQPGAMPEVERAAKIYASAKKAMILIGSGLWSHLDQKAVAIASSNLALITGHIGKESSGILVLLEKCNSQGALDMGLSPEGSHLLNRASEGKLKAFYLVGEDPLNLDSEPLRKALQGLELLVVQDLFLTETAKLAHVVLPASAFVEKEGTFTNLERRVQRLHPLRPARDDSKPDLEIFLRLLELLECRLPAGTPEAIFEEIGRSVHHYQGIGKGEQWPKGATYLYADGFPLGRAKLIPPEEREPKRQSEAYPFYLLQRPSLFQSGLLSSRSEALKKVWEKPSLEISPEDAKSLGIEDGEMVEISNPKGQSLRLKANHSPRPARGVITVPYPCPILEDEGTDLVRIKSLKPACRQAGKEEVE